jgi:hypothetical protein
VTGAISGAKLTHHWNRSFSQPVSAGSTASAPDALRKLSTENKHD